MKWAIWVTAGTYSEWYGGNDYPLLFDEESAKKSAARYTAASKMKNIYEAREYPEAPLWEAASALEITQLVGPQGSAPGDLVFTTASGEALRLKSNGDIIRNRKVLGTDPEIVEGLKSFVSFTLPEAIIARRLHATDPRVIAFVADRIVEGVTVEKVWGRDEGGWATEAQARAAEMVKL